MGALGQTRGVRYLTIVRHCHATPASPGQADVERPLSEGGHEQARALRAWATDVNALGRSGPTTALVSTSRRTRETFREAFAGTPIEGVVHYSDLIYNGRRDVSAEDILIDLIAVDPVVQSLMVVAHNPSLEELVATLALEVPDHLRRDGLPPGAAIMLALPDDASIGLQRYRVVADYIPATS